MNKKNIGAALSLVAAVAAGATAYASTVNNLDSDKNTNSMISPVYTNNNDYVSFIKSDYTNDLKNTSIAKEKRVTKNIKDDSEKVAKIEEEAKKIVAEKLSVYEQEDTYEDETTYEEASDDSFSEPEEEVTNEEASDQEVVAENEDSSNEEANKENDLVVYDDTNLDSALENNSEEELVENDTKEIAPQVDYLENNEENNTEEKEKSLEVKEETPAVEETASTVEETASEAKETTEQIIKDLVKYVNTEALNVRNSKSTEGSSNIVKTLLAGEKLSGTIDGEWFKTNDGYVKLAYLNDSYPQALIDSLNKAKVEKEAKKVETKDSVELQNESAVEPVKEAKPVKEVAKTKEVEKVNEATKEVAEQTTPEVYGQAFTGWVYNTNVLNVRDKAINGNIVGTLAKGTKVSGEIANGWVKFDYNGKTSYTSASYLTTQQVQEQTKQENKAVEEVKDEQEVVVKEAQKPAVNNNGISAANIAGQFAGYPYVWGSSNPSVGFDCSGLVVHTYRQLGVSLPHSSAAQFNTGYAVDYNNLQAGDLIFFSIKGGGIDHVGIVTSSDGTFIHASTPRSGVKYDNVYNGYYQNTFRGARRIF